MRLIKGQTQISMLARREARAARSTGVQREQSAYGSPRRGCNSAKHHCDYGTDLCLIRTKHITFEGKAYDSINVTDDGELLL